MGYSLFSNSHFQMGVTVMGFAEHFGLSYPCLWWCGGACDVGAAMAHMQRRHLSQRQVGAPRHFFHRDLHATTREREQRSNSFN